MVARGDDVRRRTESGASRVKGVAMVEYRWDLSTDRFYLMEMNLRFWGSLHLALYAGVDFPRMLADAFLFDQVPDAVVEAKQGVVCRNTFPFELGYLVSLFRNPRVPLRRKAYTSIEAVDFLAILVFVMIFYIPVTDYCILGGLRTCFWRPLYLPGAAR